MLFAFSWPYSLCILCFALLAFAPLDYKPEHHLLPWCTMADLQQLTAAVTAVREEANDQRIPLESAGVVVGLNKNFRLAERGELQACLVAGDADPKVLAEMLENVLKDRGIPFARVKRRGGASMAMGESVGLRSSLAVGARQGENGRSTRRFVDLVTSFHLRQRGC